MPRQKKLIIAIKIEKLNICMVKKSNEILTLLYFSFTFFINIIDKTL